MFKTQVCPGDHKSYMAYALDLARRSPHKPTNFSVGALLVDPATNSILASGYTSELEGNTHAEQCCFAKLAAEHSVSEEELKTVLPPSTVLYTTMEPCCKRLSGNLPCVERVLRLVGCIKTLYVGVREPTKFVRKNAGLERLQAAGIDVVYLRGLEREILEVATAGHEQT